VTTPEMVTVAYVALRTVRLKACRQKSRNASRKVGRAQAKGPMRAIARVLLSRNLALDGLAARGYSSARRKRGSVHTENAVGRRRRLAIESSVVKASITVGNREVKATGRKAVKAAERPAEPS
jgi:hypothetical protein